MMVAKAPIRWHNASAMTPDPITTRRCMCPYAAAQGRWCL
jgi:hypothetical protein